ncbi:hypothetical protein [Streptomyces sp. NPDC018031]|uniref:hypothetical protein n=1 Tax=Streptomyces sp. NPDC018031 TaxID=3365033 RepID=UPI0037B25123
MDQDELFNQLRAQKLKILGEHHAETRRLQEETSARLQEVTRKAVRAAREGQTIPCLVRWTPGPDLTIYHSRDAPCGRVRDRRNFRRMNERSARNASPYWTLSRCTACLWSRAAAIHGKRLLDESGGA